LRVARIRTRKQAHLGRLLQGGHWGGRPTAERRPALLVKLGARLGLRKRAESVAGYSTVD
jgi:hypothetical protein